MNKLFRRTVSLLTTLMILSGPAWGLGSPLLIGGDDADDHGFFSGTNQSGWLYIEGGFDNLGPAVQNGNTTAVCLGCNGSQASAAFASGFDLSTLPGLGWTRVTLTSAADLANFFNGTGATNINNAGIIYMPTDSFNVSGGIDSSQVAVVNANAGVLNTFVNSGGGLFVHDQSFATGGFGWLTTLLPGIGVVSTDPTCNFGLLDLTPEGEAAFPQLTDAIISSATPWHSYFTGDFGGLDAIATSPCAAGDQPVMLGGIAVIAPSLNPLVDFNPPGSDHTVTATLSLAGVPAPDVDVTFNVTSGPNAGDTAVETTDAGGSASFTYTGDGGIGADRIVGSFLDNAGGSQQTNEVLKFWDLDCNMNDVPDTCDLDCGGFAGACAEATQVPLADGGLPSCATSLDVDGNNRPDECNTPPVCTSAAASSGTLWPPNHAMVPIGIAGVTDAEGDALSIVATSVTQDEAVKGKGNGAGSTSPDAALSPLAVRSERNGNPKTPGDGRVYHVAFTADDGQGGSCSGVVKICVPHDQRPGATCVDGGPLYNSIP